MQEIGNGIWGDLLPPISTTFSIAATFCHPSLFRVILCANCFWRVINRECRFNLAHLSHLFSPRAGTDWKTRHQWIFTQLVFKAKPGQPTNVDWTTPQAPPLPKTKRDQSKVEYLAKSQPYFASCRSVLVSENATICVTFAPFIWYLQNTAAVTFARWLMVSYCFSRHIW